MPLARCCKSISTASSKIVVVVPGLGKLSVGVGRRRRHVSSSSYCYRRRAAPQPYNNNNNIANTTSSNNNTLPADGHDVIATEKEGEGFPLIRFRAATIRYPPPILDDALEYQNNSISLDTKQGNAPPVVRHLPQNHWNKTQSIDSIQNGSHHFDLNIWPNLECNSGGGGGHVVLGRNASGKTLLSRSILQSLRSIPNNETFDACHHHHHHQSDPSNNPFLHSGTISIHKRKSSKNHRSHHHFLSHVSFDSHSDLLLDERTTTVHRALIPSGGNRLSPAAQFLSVRLGMFPLLHRRVETLSTGEIRRVLLVRALVSKPELLVLDNAFDGLDVRGRRGLQDIVERVLKGFRMDILVQGVRAEDAARTQVLLFTHRPEEIADGMGRVTFINKGLENGMNTENRRGRNGEELVKSLLSSNEEGGSDLPNDADVRSFWEREGRSKRDATNTDLHDDDVLFHLQNLKVTRDDTTILAHLDWTMKRGERWHLAGTNGAGKSTVGRLILRASMNKNIECDSGASKGDAVVSNGSLSVIPSMPKTTHIVRGGVSWVSTELHLHATHHWGNRPVREILLHGASFMFNADRNHESRRSATQSSNEYYSDKSVDLEIATMTARWLGLLHTPIDNSTNDPFLARPFSSLSQGEQKLLLVASAIAQRPSLLILDEPCQGLDLWNRARILNLVEKICHVTDMGLLYVTHHEEELIPSISHRLCLDDGKVTYCGFIDK